MTSPVRIGLRSVPAAAGLRWVRQGFRTFARRPFGFVGLYLFVMSCLVLSMMLPPAISLAAIVLLPLLSLGFMIAAEDVLDDLPLRPTVFWSPLLANAPARRALLAIGLVYLGGTLLLVYLADSLDGGEARHWLETILTPRTDGQMPELPPLSGRGTAVLLLKSFGMTLVSVPMWHAPALVNWGRQGALQAMFSSIVSVWRTRAALTVFGLGWSVVMLVFVLVIAVVAAIVGPIVTAPIAAIALVALTAVFYVSCWFGFVDTFEITSGTRPRAAKVDDPGA